jgi:hypothetical protein
MNVKHLMAMRTQLDAIQIQLDAMIEEQLNAGSVKKEVGCEHKRTVNVSTMGESRQFFCRDCGITKEYEASEQVKGATVECST